jgi:SEC-C motif-containing protein
LKETSIYCPCGKGRYEICCGRFHEGVELADNAEDLMRSRYSAFVLKNESYLLSTWHPSTRPQEPLFNQDPTQWIGLTVKEFSEATDRLSATVEFVAIYKINGKAHRLHEISSFVYEDKQWLYVDGQFPKIK